MIQFLWSDGTTDIKLSALWSGLVNYKKDSLVTWVSNLEILMWPGGMNLCKIKLTVIW